MDAGWRAAELGERAGAYARVALRNIGREFPYQLMEVVTGAGERRGPRARHPAFYGSYDWHSAVEMHWTLVRLLRVAPAMVPGEEIRAALDEHLSAGALAGEAAFFADPAYRTFERPYGWGWFLALAHEAGTWDDPDGRRWAGSLGGLANVFVERLVAWLPRQTYPVRYGVHANSAFGLGLALPFAKEQARGGDGALLAAITGAARRWFEGDADYPAAWEPSGADFLSPALVEAELMARVLEPEEFLGWLNRFLPGIAAGGPPALFTPAVVSDPTDGQIGHLHGLNLSRAWCWRRLAETLPADDARVANMLEAARWHTEASLPFVVGSDYMLEHWLACYAVLALS